MTYPRRTRRLATLFVPALSLIASACSERITEPLDLPAAPAYAIVDAAHGGTAGFYFLPPMVKSLNHAGVFDATKAPAITICALVAEACGATVATFTGSQVKLDLDSQSYGADWKTKDAGLHPATIYRVQVTLGASVLGYADVALIEKGGERRSVNEGRYVAVNRGSTLPIRFRIEGGAPPPPPPPPPGSWSTGDFVTYDQQSWGSIGTTAANLLATQFDASYPNGVEIGVLGNGGHSALFTVVQSVLDALPVGTTPAPLGNDLLDPGAGSLSAFAGHVLALRLDVDFGHAGHLAGIGTLRFGDLRVCGLTDTPSLSGLTVRQLLATLEQALGGGTATYTFDQLTDLARNLSESFQGGAPSQWAQDHLVSGGCA